MFFAIPFGITAACQLGLYPTMLCSCKLPAWHQTNVLVQVLHAGNIYMLTLLTSIVYTCQLCLQVLCIRVGDASEEDLPLSTLAERHPSQPKPDAEGSTSPAEDAAVLETTDYNKAPASCKADFNTHAKAKNSQAVTNSQDNGRSEAENSAAEATPAPTSQGSPEPSFAPPAATVQPRTTRSRSKRMSSDASPSISIASKQSMQAEPEGKPSLTKPPSGRRKRSLTPAHPPAAAAASPAPAEAAGTATIIKTASAGKKRQRTPDTVTGAATKRPVASRRSSRLSASALSQASSEDLQNEEEDSDCGPLAPEAELTTVDATSADKTQSDGGVQLGSVANVADDGEQAAAGVLAPASDRTVPADTIPVTLTDAAPATAAGGTPTEAFAMAVSQGHVEPGEGVAAKQPHSPVSETVGASAETLHHTEHPTHTTADEHLPDQHQGTSGAHSAAVSKTAASREGLAPASKGRAPTDGKDAQVAEASTAAVVSQDTGAAAAAADVPAHAATDAAESTPLVLVAPSMAAGERPTMEKSSLLSRAAAAASVTDASSTAQAANIGSAAAREEAQAPISAAAAPLGGALAAAQAANTGPGAVDTKAGQTDMTKLCASADASGLQTFAPDTSVSAAVPDATKPTLSTDALATDVVEVSHAVPATASETQAEAVESVASAHSRPSVASSSAPTASQVQSAESPAAATAAQATTAPPAAAAAAASATAAMLNTMSVPKPPQTSGSTRIGLPNRLSLLSKSLLGPAQQKVGSTHIRPFLSKGLTTALKSDRGVKAPNSSLSEGSTGTAFCLGHPAPDLVKIR